MEIINGIDQDDIGGDCTNIDGATIDNSVIGGTTPAAGSFTTLTSTTNKLNATVAPTVNDDIDLGYVVGSRWVDITADKEYVCLDNNDGAAVWAETTIYSSDVIDDTSPQLGGNLDMGTHKLVGEGGSTGVYVDSTGNVGVGTIEPLNDLHVVGQISLGDSVTTSNTGRAFNLISTDAMLKILRIHASYGAGIEMMTRTSADGEDTARWDMATNGVTAGFSIRDRLGGDQDRIMILHDSGNVGISTTTPTTKLDVNSDILRLRTAKTPATAGADGNQGDIAWDANYIYVCTATNTWKRSGLSTW